MMIPETITLNRDSVMGLVHALYVMLSTAAAFGVLASIRAALDIYSDFLDRREKPARFIAHNEGRCFCRFVNRLIHDDQFDDARKVETIKAYVRISGGDRVELLFSEDESHASA